MSHNNDAVGVIGGGRWGVALACAARAAGRHVLVATRRSSVTEIPEAPAGCTGTIARTNTFADIVSHATLILMAVPSTTARDVARALGDHVDGRHMIVHAVRGLSDEGLVPLSEIIRQETPARRIGALGGPVLADDLLEGRASVIATASRFPEVLHALQHALSSDVLRVSTTTDLAGLEWASALVGALMVGLGYARAKGIKGGLLAGVMNRGMQEAARIGVAAGAEEHTFFSLAGVGDLMGAMTEMERPEVHFGQELAAGHTVEQVRAAMGARVEAPEFLPRVVAFARALSIDVPIFRALDAVVAGRSDDVALLPELMRRPARKK